jgi:hypothetical protein
MKKRFTYKDLADSSNYYYPIFEAIFYANCKYYKTSEQTTPLNTENPRCTIQNLLNTGDDDLFNIFDTLNIYNRCFIDLLNKAEALVALPLIRLQLENLTAIYAETLHPFQILHRLYDGGKNLGKVVIDGSYIVPSELRKELDAKYGSTIGELYKKYSGFIHPSKSQKDVELGSYYSYKKDMYIASKKDVRVYAKDMVYVNQIIGNVLLAHLEDINSKIM